MQLVFKLFKYGYPYMIPITSQLEKLTLIHIPFDILLKLIGIATLGKYSID